MEIVLKGASLYWPYLTQLDLPLAIAEAYSHCFIRPGALPNPQVWISTSLQSAMHCHLWQEPNRLGQLGLVHSADLACYSLAAR